MTTTLHAAHGVRPEAQPLLPPRAPSAVTRGRARFAQALLVSCAIHALGLGILYAVYGAARHLPAVPVHGRAGLAVTLSPEAFERRETADPLHTLQAPPELSPPQPTREPLAGDLLPVRDDLPPEPSYDPPLHGPSPDPVAPALLLAHTSARRAPRSPPPSQAVAPTPARAVSTSTPTTIRPARSSTASPTAARPSPPRPLHEPGRPSSRRGARGRTGLRIAYAPNPSRYYPAAAIRRAAHGTVRVGFLVTPSGTVSRAWILLSSGDDALDQAALSLVRAYRFAPPGGARQSQIPVTFNLASLSGR